MLILILLGIVAAMVYFVCYKFVKYLAEETPKDYIYTVGKDINGNPAEKVTQVK